MAETWGAGLPVGTLVTFRPHQWRDTSIDGPYEARVAGYDDFRSKYRLSIRWPGSDRWSAPHHWAFPSEVEPAQPTEEETTNVPL